MISESSQEEIMYKAKLTGILVFVALMLVGLATYVESQDSEDYQSIQALISFERGAKAVNFKCKSDKGQEVLVKIDICTPDMVRIRASTSKIMEKKEYLVVKDVWRKVNFMVSEQPEQILIRTQRLELRVNKEPFGLEIYDTGGNLILKESPVGIRYDNDKIYTSMEMGANEHFFGFGAGKGVGMTSGYEGENFNLLDKRGQEINIIGRRIPFFMSTKGYGIFVNSTNMTTFEMGSKMSTRYSFETKGSLLDYYFIYGPSFKHILGRYTELTGRAPLIPKWAFGLRQAGYWDQRQVEEYSKKYRNKHIPCDLIHIDSGWLDKGSDYLGHGIHYGNNPRGYVDFKWDKRQFPNPKAMISKLSKQGFKFSLWETALVNPNVGKFYDYGAKHGYFMKNPNGSVALVPYGTRGPSAVVDFSNPKAAEWWKEQHKYLIDMGVDAFKMDISGNLSTAKNAVFFNGKSVEQMRILHKLWNLRTVFDAVKDYTGKRGYIISSIATAGTQRYPVHWSGDYKNNFEGIQAKIRSAQNMGLSGFAYYSPDFPSQRNLKDPKLFIRWAQYGFLNPVCQDWCNLPWNYGMKAEDNFRFYDDLHYRLLPYFYSYAWIANQTGIPIVRAMVLEYQDDPAVYEKDLQYMLGRELLVAPIYENANIQDKYSTRNVYLPKGKWIGYWTGNVYTGPANISVKVTLDKIPLFVRAGAIIPMAPLMNYVGEKPVNPLTLDIYPSGTSSFTLYEDDGETENYKKGDFALTTFVCIEQQNGIIIDIGESRGEYKGRLKSRSYVLKVNQVSYPQDVKVERKAMKRYSSAEDFKGATKGWWYNSSKNVVLVKIGAIKSNRGTKVYLKGARVIYR